MKKNVRCAVIGQHPLRFPWGFDEEDDGCRRMKLEMAQRIMELCKSRNITVNTLANDAGVPPTTIYSMLNAKSRNPGIVTIKQVCDGLDISLREFFDSPIFDDLEQEIQ